MSPKVEAQQVADELASSGNNRTPTKSSKTKRTYFFEHAKKRTQFSSTLIKHNKNKMSKHNITTTGVATGDDNSEAQGDSKQHNNNNNNNNPSNQSGDTTPDSFVEFDAKRSSSKLRFDRARAGANQTCCSTNKTKLLCCLMGAILITAIALLVAAYAFNLFRFVNEPERCIDQSSAISLQSLDNEDHYELFATKTTYENARKELELTRREGINKSLFNKSDLRSFDKIVEDLVVKDGCGVKQIHYFGRHATRFPSKDDLERIVKNMDIVKNRLNDLLKHTKNNQRSANQTSASSPTTSVQPINEVVCYDPLVNYGQWQSSDILGTQKTSNLITSTGVKETQAIVSRFKKLFPNLFNSHLSNPDFGVTQEIRTAQTAHIFMKNIDHLNPLYGCDLNNTNDFPSFITDDSSATAQGYAPRIQPASATVAAAESLSNEIRRATNLSITRANELAGKITSSACFKKLIDKYEKKDLLSFHKECNTFLEASRNPAKLDHKLDLDADKRIEHISKSVSRKLRLADGTHLTANLTRSIYDVCRYETAISGKSSIWCNLFSDTDLQFLEYIADVKDYFNSAYGSRALAESACVIGSKLYDSLDSPDTNESKFYFTHSEVLQRLIALSTRIYYGPNFKKDDVRKFLDSRKVPDTRDWKTSLLTPFSANMAFTIFKCPAPVKKKDDPTTIYRIVATLNEQPIVLAGCFEPVCELNRFTKFGNLVKEKECRTPENYCHATDTT